MFRRKPVFIKKFTSYYILPVVVLTCIFTTQVFASKDELYETAEKRLNKVARFFNNAPPLENKKKEGYAIIEGDMASFIIRDYPNVTGRTLGFNERYGGLCEVLNVQNTTLKQRAYKGWESEIVPGLKEGYPGAFIQLKPKISTKGGSANVKLQTPEIELYEVPCLLLSQAYQRRKNEFVFAFTQTMFYLPGKKGFESFIKNWHINSLDDLGCIHTWKNPEPWANQNLGVSVILKEMRGIAGDFNLKFFQLTGKMIEEFKTVKNIETSLTLHPRESYKQIGRSRFSINGSNAPWSPQEAGILASQIIFPSTHRKNQASFQRIVEDVTERFKLKDKIKSFRQNKLERKVMYLKIEDIFEKYPSQFKKVYNALKDYERKNFDSSFSSWKDALNLTKWIRKSGSKDHIRRMIGELNFAFYQATYKESDGAGYMISEFKTPYDIDLNVINDRT